MAIWAALLLVLVFIPACAKRSGAELTLERYVTAIHERRCDVARELLSEQTVRGLEILAKPRARESPRRAEEYFCSEFAFEHCRLSKMEPKEIIDDRAVITMPCGRTQDSILPGFTSIFLKYEPREVELIRESGNWRVIEPLVLRYSERLEKEDLWHRQALENERRYDMERRTRQVAARDNQL